MRICVLMGSPRKRDSYGICKIIEKSFSTCDVEFEYLFLKDYNILHCKGCDKCFEISEKDCPCKDDISILKEKLLSAAGIIFVSPVYACQVTGLMKTTLDRLSYLFHRQEFVGKPALIVVTTGGGGQKPTGRYLKMTACGWGCRLIGQISIISPRFFDRKGSKSSWGYDETYHKNALRNIKKAAANLEKAVLSQTLQTPTYYDIFMFQCLRSKTFVSKADHEYWKKKGWLDSEYFYKSKLSRGKRLFGKFIKAYVDLAVKRMSIS